MKRNKHLNCGCCGAWFKTWTGYRDQDQDKGYGICQECQIDSAWRDHEMLTDLIARFADCLTTGNNREKFESMDRPLQESFIYRAMDKGLITWQIGGAT